MSSSSQHKSPLFKYLRNTLLGVVLIVILAAVVGAVSRSLEFSDDDPDRGAISLASDPFDKPISRILYLDQGWDAADSLWFYNTTQGSNLMPYDFFIALELAGGETLVRNPDNMNRYRYLPQKATSSNPDGLPVGFSRDRYQGKSYMGFTCAACHTNQLNFNGTAIRVDGGPAAADLEMFMHDLSQAMLATLNNPEKLSRFSQRVLDLGEYDDIDTIQSDLEKYSRRVYAYNVINHPQAEGRPLTRYGYARLDAFGRIFNRVLEHIISTDQLRELLLDVVDPQTRDQVLKDIEPLLNGEQRDHLLDRLHVYLTPAQQQQLRERIFNPADAPVSYPFLWDIPQHDYVQWNGIVNNAGIGNIGRNAGQVIGVFGTLDWQQQPGWTVSSVLGGQGFGETHINFQSSIHIRNLRRVEDHLYNLQSPLWPENILPAIDRERWERGRILFDHYCESCHQRIDRSSEDRRVIAHMSHINSVGTDPKMALNSVAFSGFSGILRNKYVDLIPGDLLIQQRAPVAALLRLSAKNVVTTPDPDKLFIRRWAERAFDFVITIFRNEVKPSLKQGDYDPATTANPLAPALAYKARSLNGIWATAPYLHNGSVPTLYDLLLPKKREGDSEDGEYRPDQFVVGSREFDAGRVGFKDSGYAGFVFDTRIPGNHNSGHEYAAGRSPQPNGEILPALDREQRLDLLEYLKSL